MTMKHPEWALKHKRKGTELRFINGNYYLYEVSSKWNPEKKRPQKITGKLLGRVTPQGFVESPKHQLHKKSLAVESLVVKEYGASRFIVDYMSEDIDKLKEFFPELWQTIVLIAFIRLLHQAAIKNMPFHFHQSYLSVLYSQVSFTERRIGQFLRELGAKREQIVRFIRSFIRRGDYILIDVTHIFSRSKNLSSAKLGYNSQREYVPQINLVFIFSSLLKLPVYYRITPGNIREVRAFKLSLEESGIDDAVCIADKGFYSQDNVNQLNAEALRFIIPLKRNSELIQYQPVREPEKRGFKGYFKFENRFIWYHEEEKQVGRVILYLDETLKGQEERDYLSRIETHPESFSLQEFHNRQSTFGTVALLNNLKDKSAEEVYQYYKSRVNIEKMFDIMKNVLEADRTYMQNELALEGWMFTNYLALQWYYRIYQMIVKRKQISKYSPKDLLLRLTEVKKVKINEEWKLAEMTNKTKTLVELFNIPIT